MITIFYEKYKTISQKNYDNLIEHIQIHQLRCSCGHSGCLIKYGHYHRFIKHDSDKVRLKILRVSCRHCGKTHALIPSYIVPYSQVRLDEQAEIVHCYSKHLGYDSLMQNNTEIDESCIRSVIRRYLHNWKQKLISASVNLFPTYQLTQCCFSSYSMQFMQIKSTTNIFFRPPT